MALILPPSHSGSLSKNRILWIETERGLMYIQCVNVLLFIKYVEKLFGQPTGCRKYAAVKLELVNQLVNISRNDKFQ